MEIAQQNQRNVYARNSYSNQNIDLKPPETYYPADQRTLTIQGYAVPNAPALPFCTMPLAFSSSVQTNSGTYYQQNRYQQQNSLHNSQYLSNQIISVDSNYSSRVTANTTKPEQSRNIAPGQFKNQNYPMKRDACNSQTTSRMISLAKNNYTCSAITENISDCVDDTLHVITVQIKRLRGLGTQLQRVCQIPFLFEVVGFCASRSGCFSNVDGFQFTLQETNNNSNNIALNCAFYDFERIYPNVQVGNCYRYVCYMCLYVFNAHMFFLLNTGSF